MLRIQSKGRCRSCQLPPLRHNQQVVIEFIPVINTVRARLMFASFLKSIYLESSIIAVSCYKCHHQNRQIVTEGERILFREGLQGVDHLHTWCHHHLKI